MSEVFISYARPSEAKAQQIADALRNAGFEVWLDAQIPTHRIYYEVIEEHLRAASAVVVVWSKAAADSQWVRAEADLARSLSKLVQATADGEIPPMPFNQTQYAQLKTWHGDPDHPEWRKILQSVEALTARTPKTQQPLPAWRRLGWKPWAASATVAALMVGAGLYLVLGRGAAPPAAQAPFVAVLPFQALSNDPTEASFTAALADEVAGVLSENSVQTLLPAQGAALAGPGRKAMLQDSGARYALGGTVRHENGVLRVRVYLEDIHSGLSLWSQQFERPTADSARLRDVVAVAVTETVYDALDTLKQSGLTLDPQTAALYIRGASAAHSSNVLSPLKAPQALEEVVAREPRFGRGHAMLAEILSRFVRTEHGEFRPLILARMRKEVDAAIRISPSTSGPAYGALNYVARTEPPRDLKLAEDFLLKGLREDPEYAYLNLSECDFLWNVGRNRDAAEFCAAARRSGL